MKQTELSTKQKHFLTMLASGCSLIAIAKETAYSLGHVKNELANARKFLGAKTNTQAVVLYDRRKRNENNSAAG